MVSHTDHGLPPCLLSSESSATYINNIDKIRSRVEGRIADGQQIIKLNSASTN